MKHSEIYLDVLKREVRRGQQVSLTDYILLLFFSLNYRSIITYTYEYEKEK